MGGPTKYVSIEGLKISVIGLGTWQIGDQRWRGYSYKEFNEIIKYTKNVGVNHIDTAELYGNGRSEEFIGRAIVENGLEREYFVLATKIRPRFAKDHDIIKKTLIKSLERLRTKYVDIYYLHWPSRNIDICKVMKAFETLWYEGFIRAIGVSNFNINELKRAEHCLSKTRIRFLQNKLNILSFDDKTKALLEYCKRNSIVYVAYSPLEQGVLSGKYSSSNPPPSDIRLRNKYYRHIDILEPLITVIRIIATKYNVKPSSIALAWILKKGAIAIPASRTLQQFIDNALSASLDLSEEDTKLLENIARSVKANLP